MGKIKTKTKKKSQAALEQSKFPYQKFRIWWTDPTGDTGWATPAEFDRMVYSEPISEAWVYKKDKKSIKLFASYDRDPDGSICFGDRNCFPISNIKKMEKLDG
jgi:hypothetical protein|tara:strand:+ start:135 stop:443 length:309 start_codon:yes stop_codon:yes gene_type:complete